MALGLVGSAARKLQTAGAVVAFVTALAGGQAQAVPSCTTTTNLGAAGSGSVPFASVGAGICVISQDKLYGNFNLGNLPAVGNLGFSLTTFGDTELHGLAFNTNYVQGSTYSFGYEVAVFTNAVPGSVITSLDSDFTQSASSNRTAPFSTLTKNSLPRGTPSTGIRVIKSGNVVQSGSVSIVDYSPGVTDLVISETLVDHGAISSIINTVTETIPQVPEPASLALLGVGLTGLGLLRRGRR